MLTFYDLSFFIPFCFGFSMPVISRAVFIPASAQRLKAKRMQACLTPAFCLLACYNIILTAQKVALISTRSEKQNDPLPWLCLTYEFQNSPL
ncbi:hypothetical protein [Holdemania massiliensis]|uniref:hypothetical protein n=1 Tax=Holdemania massiliensis TaxID=1468449 RepID=UPI0019D58C1C|nr:hypothetical protein [Holdemania massiliensis]